MKKRKTILRKQKCKAQKNEKKKKKKHVAWESYSTFPTHFRKKNKKIHKKKPYRKTL
jgi:hypothetical protein